MPAEWTPHAATWLAWPHDPLTWPDRVPKAEAAFARMIEALSQGERVELLVKDAPTESRARNFLATARLENVRFHQIPTADSWFRDYGPTFLKHPTGGAAWIDWTFNAWGRKYESLLADDAIPLRIAPLHGFPRFEADVVMEGGSIEVDGAGTLLTTEQCLLNPNRNPHLSRSEIEQRLRDFLGVEQVLWLKEGIVGDDTDGHIDDLARFVDERTILAAVEENPEDENYSILQDNLERLRAFRDPNGRPFRIVELPMPGPILDDEGERLPASYANFYVANGVVLLPTFGHAHDARAQRVLEGLFRNRRVVPIPCQDLVFGMGALHCVTQQQPA